MASVLGIDYGAKKIGVAIGQDITKTSRPLSIIKNNNNLWNEINKIIVDWQPKIIIVGKPELRDGNKHPLEEEIEKFIYQLKYRYNMVIYRENEAYSSCEARRIANSREDTASIDDYAAAVILESWMQANS